MADGAAPRWSFEGEHFENCNCAVARPCIFVTEPPFTSPPTEGACEVAFAFPVRQGAFGDVTMGDLSVVIAVGDQGSNRSGHGLHCDNSGRDDLYSPIHWTNA